MQTKQTFVKQTKRNNQIQTKCNLVSSMEKKCNCVKICQIHSYNMQFKYFNAIISYSINSKGNANSNVNMVVWESRSEWCTSDSLESVEPVILIRGRRSSCVKSLCDKAASQKCICLNMCNSGKFCIRCVSLCKPLRGLLLKRDP